MAGYIPTAGRENWRTPPEVIAVVREALGGKIALDPCASRSAPREELIGSWNVYGPDTRTRDELAPGEIRGEPVDGLTLDWHELAGTVFVNPPFGQNAKWVRKCVEEAKKGCEIILLIPARTDTRYWHQGVARADAICFWRGRIKFVGAENVAPFPVAFAYWGNHPYLFRDAFEAHGQVLWVWFRPELEAA